MSPAIPSALKRAPTFTVAKNERSALLTAYKRTRTEVANEFTSQGKNLSLELFSMQNQILKVQKSTEDTSSELIPTLDTPEEVGSAKLLDKKRPFRKKKKSSKVKQWLQYLALSEQTCFETSGSRSLHSRPKA